MERSYAEKFGKEESSKILEKVRESLMRRMRHEIKGWGKHGIIDDVTDRRSQAICHRGEFSISSISELEKLRRNLEEWTEEPIETVENCLSDINRTAREKLDELVPFKIKANTLEGFLAFFLWFRKPGGGFEYQLYRFAQENFEGSVRKEEIRDALLRLEVHGYINVKEVPQELTGKLRDRGIRRAKRFYEGDEKKIPGRKLLRELKGKTHIGAYLAPLPLNRLVNEMEAPAHQIRRELRDLKRRNYISERKVKDLLGRKVRKIKPKRRSKDLTGLKRKIMEKVRDFYEVQKSSLDKMQAKRPH